MTDAPDTADAEIKKKRFRSPAYPAITLQKAIERVAELHTTTLQHAAPATVLASAWSYGNKSSGLFATIAALKQFGLLIDEGSGPKRRFQLTDRAIRIVRDPDPGSEKRREALRQAALTPKIHKELWEKYDIAGLSGSMDMALKGYLTVERSDDGEPPYSSAGADEVISEYKATFVFAGLAESGIVSLKEESEQDSGNLGGLTPSEAAKIGDFVQWTSDGVDQFKLPRKVEWVSDDGTHLRVHGSPTGIHMEEVTVTAPPAPPKVAGGPAALGGTASTGDATQSDINVYLTGNRLQITADVDEKGLITLKKVLGQYEEILKLLSQPVHGAMATKYTDDEEGRQAEKHDREREG